MTPARSSPTTTTSPRWRARFATTASASPGCTRRSGYNSRLDELQAAALRVLLPHLRGLDRRAGPPPAPTERAGIDELCRGPARDRPRAQRSSPLRIRTQRAAELSAGSRGRHRDPGLLHDAATPQPAFVHGSRSDAPQLRTARASRGLALPMGQALDESTAESRRRRDPGAGRKPGFEESGRLRSRTSLFSDRMNRRATAVPTHDFR